MRNDHQTLWYLLDKLADIADIYTRLKANEEERDTNTLLGKWAIKYNILFFIFFAGATAMGIWASFMFQTSFWYGILIVLGVLLLAIFAVVYVILAFASEIAQMKLNKRPIGLIMLLTTFAIILAAVIAIAVTVVMGL